MVDLYGAPFVSKLVKRVHLWPSITYVNLGMYLLVTPSPYSGEDLMNYKSLDCYKKFLYGWVREDLSQMMRACMEKGVVTAKVCITTGN